MWINDEKSAFFQKKVSFFFKFSWILGINREKKTKKVEEN